MTETNQPPGALDGVRVVEMCQGVGGPMLAMLLAEQGADVVKVEPPAGDWLRGRAAFHVLNRSKRGIVLDPESAGGRERLRSLLVDADVFLYDWIPGEAERRGFAPDDLLRINPTLVAGYLPAYGSRGRWAHLPPDEALVQALSGVADAQYRYDPPPAFVTIPVGGYAQAIVGAGAVAASLFARSRSGRGDRFELSAVAALFQFETIAWLRAPGIMRLAGQQDPRGPIPTYRLVKASDDWFFAGALTPPFWASMAVAAGLEECLADARFAGAPLAIPVIEDRRELARRVDTAFATKSRDRWLQILEQADVPRAPVLSRADWACDPQVLHNGMVVDVHDPELGPTRQMGVPVTLQASPGRIRGPAPLLGEHDADELWPRSAAGAPHSSAVAAAPRDHPLDGVTVIDLGGFIAGASCSMMLADLGADVIKIESPDGDGWRTSGLAFLGSNRSKRGLCVDLKRPEGRDLFLDLIERADVVLDNLRAGVMERLGIGYEALRERNPRIVHCSVTGYGPTGPYAHLPGFDPMAQARGGVMRAQGASDGEPVYLQVAVCDYGTALTASFGIMTALVARERTGLGDRVETNLANSALTMQAGEFIFHEGRPDDPPGGRDLAGRNALYRIYGASDGFLMLACRAPAHAHALADATGVSLAGQAGPGPGTSTSDAVPGDAWVPEGEPLALNGPVAVSLAGAFASRPLQEWLDTLLQRGVPVAPCLKVEQIFDDAHMLANELWWDAEHPRWGVVRQTGHVIRWDGMSMSLSRRAPLLGEHSLECLRDLGIDEGRISALIDKGVVVQAG